MSYMSYVFEPHLGKLALVYCSTVLIVLCLLDAEAGADSAERSCCPALKEQRSGGAGGREKLEAQ